MSTLKYKLYPSALNNFQALLDADVMFEASSNLDAEGEYKRTIEEIEEELTKNLLDTINRVSHGPIEAADKGTAFNEVIDRIILNANKGNDKINIWSSKDYEVSEGEKASIPCVYAEINGFKFAYDLYLCKDVARDMTGALPQYRCSAILPTRYGDVELYGFVDYILKDRVIDLKTTSRYAFPKFEGGWQKLLYPYCLIASGDMSDVSEFEYYVVQWRSLAGKPLNGTIYKEAYTYRHDYAKGRLIAMCEHLIEWLESHRELITDKKIFALE